MKRRDFALRMPLAGACVLAAGTVHAQSGPVEGKDYVRLAQPIAMPAGAKIDVVEFFGYWCPHCNAFEPALESWARRLPSNVAFRRVPVAFSSAHEPYQRMYYALEAVGQLDSVHRKIFAAVHLQRMRFDKESDVVAFVSSHGVDAARFTDAYKSFGVQSKIRQAKQLSDAYRIDGVPTLGIHGRFFTSPSVAGGPERALQVADALIQRVSKG